MKTVKIVLLFLFFSIFEISVVFSNTHKIEEYKLGVTIPEEWTVIQNSEKTSNRLLTANNGSSTIYIFADVLTDKNETHNFRKIKIKRKQKYDIEDAVCIYEEYPPFYNLLSNRITRVFELSNGIYVKQILLVRLETLFIVNIVKSTNDFEEEDKIIKTINTNQSIKSSFNLYLDNAKDGLRGFIGIFLVVLFAFLGYCFDKYRRKNSMLGIFFLILSIPVFIAVFFMLKDYPPFAILGILVYFMMWMSLQKTMFTKIMNDIARNFD